MKSSEIIIPVASVQLKVMSCHLFSFHLRLSMIFIIHIELSTIKWYYFSHLSVLHEFFYLNKILSKKKVNHVKKFVSTLFQGVTSNYTSIHLAWLVVIGFMLHEIIVIIILILHLPRKSNKNHHRGTDKVILGLSEEQIRKLSSRIIMEGWID